MQDDILHTKKFYISIGLNGSSSSYASNSCLNIKLLAIGQDTGDGRYWIKPGDTGSPFTVHCDMTTDGGKKWAYMIGIYYNDQSEARCIFITQSKSISVIDQSEARYFMNQSKQIC
jgi:hypothetical protein